MEKLDKKDRKILTVLAYDPRITYTELAKHIQLSKNATKYRLDSLMQRGIVEKVLPVIDYVKLGLITYEVFLKCSPNHKTKQAIDQYLASHKNIIWSTEVFGGYDYFFEILTPSPFELDKIMTEIVQLLGDSFRDFKSVIATRRLKIQPLVEELQEPVAGWHAPERVPLDRSPVVLDAIDKRILKSLCEDGRKTYLEIGQELNTTLQTIKNRMQRLISNRTILNFMPMLGYKKLGYTDYILLLRTRLTSQEKERQLSAFFDKRGEVKLVLHIVNTNELELFVCVQHPDVMEKLISDLKAEFPDQIVGAEFMHILKELRLNFFPEGLL